MNYSISLTRGLMFVCLAVLLSGCGAPAAAPTLASAIPSVPTPQPLLQTPLPSPTPNPTVTPTGQPTLFKFIRTVQVTPDENFLGGGFARINYVPATDRLVVTFGGGLAHPSQGCMETGYSYKVYTMEMLETGESGTFTCDGVDSGSVMVENSYYFAAMSRRGDEYGWHLLKLDAVSWKKSVDKFFPVDYPKESEADPMVAYVNGRIDISSGYNVSGKPHSPGDPAGSYGTHHQLFSTDLQFQSEKILTDPPHIHGSSMVYAEGVYYLVTADDYIGDVMVMKYDQNWKYLGGKTLIQQAHFSTGLVYDSRKFYLAYTDTSQRTDPGFFPVYLNIHLAVFDRDWNLLEDLAVTDYAVADNMQTGRPWVILHGNRLYVSYDLDTMDPVTHSEMLKGQAIVSVYELTQSPSP